MARGGVGLPRDGIPATGGSTCHPLGANVDELADRRLHRERGVDATRHLRCVYDISAAAARKWPVLNNAATPTEETILLAIVAAILFLIALVFELASVTFGPLGALVFITAGLLCLALQFAGVGRSRL